jgi:ribosomal protein L1
MLDKLVQLLKELMDRKFYGSVEIKFESGNVVIIRKTESIKL